MKKRLLGFILAAIMCLGMSGCDSEETSETAQTKDSAVTDPSDVEVAVIFKSLSAEYWKTMKAGAEAAASDLGISVTVLGPSDESEIAQQVTMIEEQIAANVSAIVVAPCEENAVIGALEPYVNQLPVLMVDPGKTCGALGMGLQQMVEIAKAIQLNSKLIIMDEPTSSLGQKEVDQLMETVRRLKHQGIAILFVSHKLEELFELCDRVTVMRDGEHVCTENITDMSNESLINAMVGRTLDNLFPKETAVKGEVMLKVSGLSSTGVLDDVSFEAYGGEIRGFAGLVGAGRTETMRAVFGADPKDDGEIFIKGKKVDIRSPKDDIREGIVFLHACFCCIWFL